ncbi:hypothetical protein CDL15_Pgr027242 [Punica granatum]|uniref:Uncharacterized protein n=1 Tax=Punica granatum TaxID=22663 RepID=A0A218Y2V8_PUNGR|nr:hypothetical protein CDL15_Pgr027242 [Punica granatum]
MHPFFYASQVRRVCSLVLLANLLNLLANASFLLRIASSASLLTRASCKSAEPARQCILSFTHRKFGESAHSCFLQTCKSVGCPRPCILSFRIRKFAESAHWCFLQIYRVCSPCILSFKHRKFAESAHSCFFQTAGVSPLTRASCKYAGAAPLCILSFTVRKFAESAHSCFLQICRGCTAVHPFFYRSQVRRVRSLVLLANMPGLHRCASFLLPFASSPSPLTRASCKYAGAAPLCILSFTVRKFAESAHSCFLQICRGCTAVHPFFYRSQVRRVRSLVLLANMPGLHRCASFLLPFASSPSPLTRASCKYAGAAPLCILSFTVRKFAESAHSCFLQICRGCTAVHPFFYRSQVRRVRSLVLLANMPGLHRCASFLLPFASSPSPLTRASCKYAGAAPLCILSFTVRKFAESAHSCFLQICRGCTAVHPFFYRSQVRRVRSLVLLANMPGLHRCASFLLPFASSPSPLTRASCKYAGAAPLCILSFTVRKFAESAHSCFLQICRGCTAVHPFFYRSQVRRVRSLVLLANMPGLHRCASFLLPFASSPSPLTRASCKYAGAAPLCILSFTVRKFAESAHSCFLQICRGCTAVHPFFYRSQVRRVRSLVLLANMPGLHRCASFLLPFASSPSPLTRASCKYAGAAPLCILSFTVRKFAESAHSCFLQICRGCTAVHPFFYRSQVRRVRSLVLLANMPGLHRCASFLLPFASSPSPLTRASCKYAGAAPLCILSFTVRKFAESAHSCFLQICRGCTAVHPFFYRSQVRRVRSLVLLANMPGLHRCASFLLPFASSPSPLTRASCKYAGAAPLCILSFTVRKFAESAHSCFLQICRGCTAVHPFFYRSQVRRVRSLVLLANMPGLHRCASFLLPFASSPSPLTRASCKYAGAAPLCILSFTVRKFAESAHSCFLQICRGCTAVHPFFYRSQVRRVRSLVLLANMPGLHRCASFLLPFASSPSPLTRASCKYAGAAPLCILSFTVRKFAESAHSCFLQICRGCTAVHPFFYRSQVRRVRSLVLLANMPGLHRCASFLLPFASSPSPLTRASCKYAGAAPLCILSFTVRKFAESAHSCFLQICRGCTAVHPFFYRSQVRRVRSLVLLANMPGLHRCASFLLPFASSPSPLTRASCKYAGAAPLCILSFTVRKFAESAHSCFLQICRGCTAVHPFFYRSQVRRVRSLVLLANMPGLHRCASFLLPFASSPSPLTRASCKYAGAAPLCILSFTVRKFAESAHSCFLQICRGCTAVHPFFYRSQVRRVRSLVLLANMPGLHRCASFLLPFASSPSPLTRASCKYAGAAPLCILSFTVRKFAESAHSCFLQICRGCTAVHPFFYRSQVRRVRSLVLLANMPGLHRCASFLLPFASSPSPLTRASCKYAGAAPLCILSFTVRKFAESAHSCFLQICRGCTAVHPFFYRSQVRRVRSLVLLANMPGLHRCASFLLPFASSPSPLTRASCKYAGAAPLCILSFTVRKFAESAHSCFLQICRGCTAVHPFFYRSQVRRVRSLVLLANMPGLHRCASFLLPFASSPSPLTRASCKYAGAAPLCILSFTVRKFAESAHSCFLQICRGCTAVHPFFYRSQVRRVRSLVLLANMPGLHRCASFLLPFASSPSPLTRASCKYAGAAPLCILSFTVRKFAESAHSCFLQICRGCTAVHPFFYRSQVRRVRSLVLLANMPGLHRCASFLLPFASSPSPLTRASCKYAGAAPLCILSFTVRKFAESAHSCFLQICRGCTAVHPFFYRSQVRRVRSLVLLANMPGLHRCASFLLPFASSPSPLTRASCKYAGAAPLCILSFTVRKFAESAHSCFLQICRGCTAVHPFFYRSQVRRVRSLVLLANMPGLHRCASFLLPFASSPSPLTRASCKYAGAAPLCILSFTVRKFAESAHSCFLQICRGCTAVHPFFYRSQVRRVRSLVLLANMPGLHRCASFLLPFASSPSPLTRASCKYAGAAPLCILSFTVRKFAESAHSCFLQICRGCTAVHPFFYRSQVRRVRSLVLLANMPGLHRCASFLLPFASSPSPLTRASCKYAGAAPLCILSFTVRKFAESAHSCFLQICRGCTAVHPFFYRSQVRRVRSLVLLANMPGLHRCASFLLPFASSPSPLTRASCKYAGAAPLCILSFTVRKFAESAHSCFLQICRGCTAVHPFFYRSQVRRVRSLVLLANMPGLHRCASFLLPFASSPSPLTRASCKYAGAAPLCILSFTVRKFAESAHSCFLQICRGCTAVHPFFYRSQVRRVRSLVLLANMPGLHRCASFLLPFASSPSPLTRASCKYAGAAPLCILSFTVRKFAESAHSCFLQICRGCTAVHPFFYRSQVRRVRSLVLLANMPGLHRCASFLLPFASSPSPLTRASCKYAGAAPLCILSFTVRKFAESAHSCFLQICRGCTAVHPFFYRSQVRRVRSLVLLANMPGLHRCASFLLPFASSPSPLTRASCKYAGAAPLCILSFTVRKFAESAHSCFLQICRGCTAVHPFFYRSQVRRVRSLVLLANMPGLHRCASFLLPFASSPSPLTRASCKYAGAAPLCILSFTVRKFAESAHSCFLQICRGCTAVHPFFYRSQVRRVRSLVLLANMPGLHRCASFLLPFASSPSPLTRASCKYAGAAPLCILSFTVRKFAESAHSCFLQICRGCTAVHPFFYRSQVRRVRSLVLLANMPGLHRCASFLLPFASSPSPLTRASCKYAGAAPLCILSFTVRKFAESAHSCFLQICRGCTAVHPFFYRSQVRRVRSLVLLANMPGLHRCASFLLPFASSPSPLTRASCKYAGAAPLCILSFTVRKFAESAHSCFLQICRGCTAVHPFFYRSQVRRVRSLVLLANMPGLHRCASFLLPFASSPSPLTRASCKYAGAAPLCILSFTVRKFAESAHSCFLQICRGCTAVHPFFYRSQVRRVRSLVLLANMPGLHRCASFLLPFASSPSPLTRASCKYAGAAPLCILSFTVRKFAESAHSCFLQICRGCTAVHPFFYRSQVRRVRSLVLLANMPGLHRCASFLLPFASSPSPLTRASCKYAGAAPLCILSFTVRKFAESAHSCFLQICRGCTAVHPFFYRSQVRRVRSLVLLANMPGLHRCASFLLPFASSPSPLTRASCKYAGAAPLCILSFTVRKFAESAHSCFLQICRGCTAVHPFFYRSQVRRVRSLVLLANMPGLHRCASFLLPFASSPSPLTRASCKYAGAAPLCILSFTVRKFAESAHSCFLQICRGCTAVHPFFYRSQVRRVRSLVLLANMPGLHRCASFLLPFASSPSPLTRASCKYAGAAPLCILSFTVRKFAESAHSCFLQICRGCTAVHPFFYRSQVRRVRSLVLLANMPGLHRCASFLLPFASSPSPLTRASCKYAGAAPLCILSFTVRKFAESAHSCFLQICRGCTAVHPFFYRSQVRRVRSLVLLANMPGLHRCASFLLPFASSPSPLTRASCKYAGAAPLCILSFTVRKFAESAHSCFLQICRGCTAVHPFFYRSQVRRVRSLVLLANMPGLHRCASFLLPFASSPSPLTRASCKYAGAAPLCILSFTVRKFAESAHSCFLQICGACSPMHPFTFRKFAESADSCFL